MASNDRRSMGLRRLAKMLFTYRMPGFLSESRQPESTRLVPMWPGMRLRLIDSFPGQPCAPREGEGPTAKLQRSSGRVRERRKRGTPAPYPHPARSFAELRTMPPSPALAGEGEMTGASGVDSNAHHAA